MDVDASRMGQTHSNAKKKQLMDENKCFYCEIKGHQARVCRKKIVDRAKNGKTADSDNPTVRVASGTHDPQSSLQIRDFSIT